MAWLIAELWLRKEVELVLPTGDVLAGQNGLEGLIRYGRLKVLETTRAAQAEG